MKKFVRITAMIFTVLLAVAYIICSLAPYIHPEKFSLTSILGLAYLPVLIVFSIVIITWFIFKRRVGFILLFILLIGYKGLFSTISFNVFAGEWQPEKDSSTIRVLSWNVNRLGSPYTVADTPASLRHQMLDFIFSVDADIICFQDFVLSETKDNTISFVNNIATILDRGKFTSSYFPFYYEYEGSNYTDKIGVMIFSKYPAIDSGSFQISQHERSGYIDMLINKKPVRVYAAHLTSMSLWPNDRNETGVDYLKGDSTKLKAQTLFSKLIDFGKLHASEAEVLKQHINQSPYPVILSADINSVPSGYVYHHLRSGLNDCFLEGGFGNGGTYNRLVLKPRIDVLFHSDQLEVIQFTRPKKLFSDHYPLIADFKMKE